MSDAISQLPETAEEIPMSKTEFNAVSALLEKPFVFSNVKISILCLFIALLLAPQVNVFVKTFITESEMGIYINKLLIFFCFIFILIFTMS
jgi:hypothetical protein